MAFQPPVVAALLLTASILAGCAANEDEATGPDATPPLVRDPNEVWPLLSPALYAETEREQVWVASFDGKRLDNWVYRPKTPHDVQVPVVVNFSPYWGNLAPAAETGGDHFSEYLLDYYVPRGYAVVLSSVRGTGHSEGCFNVGGETEQRDAIAVIEHFAAQPWSNGAVAAGGKSYDGTTPNGAAVLAPPALKAILPTSPISEFYKYTYKGGLPYGGLHGATFNARYVETVGWGGVPPDDALMADDLACPDYPVIAGSGVASAATGDYTDYWQERDYAAVADRAKAAMFLVHGLQDWNVKPDHILPWLEHYAGPVKVWLHQWTTPGGDGHVYPFRQDWNYTMLRFLDHALKGIDTGLFDEPAVQVEDSLGRWRHEDEWPPARAQPAVWYLRGGSPRGSLQPEPSTAGETRSFVDDGQAPDGDAGNGQAQLVYDSGPLETETHIAGVPIVHLSVSTDKALGKVAVNLYDVAPGGEARLINWGGQNLRHRADERSPQAVTPGENYPIEVELFPQDTVVAAGHILRLALAGNAGPGSYEGFQELPWGSTITLREDADSFLWVPRLAAGGLRLEEPAPAESYCWAC